LKELEHYLDLKRSKFIAESNQNLYNVTLLSISENKTTCQHEREEGKTMVDAKTIRYTQVG